MLIVFVVKESWVIHFPIRPTPMLSVLYLRQRQHLLAMVNLQIYLRISPPFESQCMMRLARLAVARRGLLHAVRGGGLSPHHAVPGPPGHHGQVTSRAAAAAMATASIRARASHREYALYSGALHASQGPLPYPKACTGEGGGRRTPPRQASVLGPPISARVRAGDARRGAISLPTASARRRHAAWRESATPGAAWRLARRRAMQRQACWSNSLP